MIRLVPAAQPTSGKRLSWLTSNHVGFAKTIRNWLQLLHHRRGKLAWRLGAPDQRGRRQPLGWAEAASLLGEGVS